MRPSGRKIVMTIVQSHGFNYPAACLHMLCFECHLMYSQMNGVHVCIIMTREHPETIEFNIGELGVACAVGPIAQAVIASNANKSSVNNNLKMLMLIPKNEAGVPLMKGEKLFDHMCCFRNVQRAAVKGEGESKDSITPLELSSGLSVHLYSDLLKSIQPTANQLLWGVIIKDSIGNNAACKNAQQKLNLYGYLVGHCGVVNSVKNMNRMKEQLIMADSVAEIYCKDAVDKELEKH